MKYRLPLFVLCCFAVIGLTTNSCEKNNSDNIPVLFTGGQWQLSSMQVTYATGALTDSVVFRDTTCTFIQAFTFNADNTCTFTNYSCDPQTSSGHWSLSTNKIFLNSDISVDSSGVKVMPFKNAQIQNLGQYSLVLNTGDLQSYYLPTTKRVITQYEFVRVKTH
ncbi:MAG TPA: lipocalin family protein [Mucilaginibacter sp.]